MSNETMPQKLERAGCVSNRVAQFNPQGFGNTWSLFPVPREFEAAFNAMIAAKFDDYNPSAIEWLDVVTLTGTGRMAILDWIEPGEFVRDFRADGTPQLLWEYWITQLHVTDYATA